MKCSGCSNGRPVNELDTPETTVCPTRFAVCFAPALDSCSPGLFPFHRKFCRLRASATSLVTRAHVPHLFAAVHTCPVTQPICMISPYRGSFTAQRTRTSPAGTGTRIPFSCSKSRYSFFYRRNEAFITGNTRRSQAKNRGYKSSDREFPRAIPEDRAHCEHVG